MVLTVKKQNYFFFLVERALCYWCRWTHGYQVPSCHLDGSSTPGRHHYPNLWKDTDQKEKRRASHRAGCAAASPPPTWWELFLLLAQPLTQPLLLPLWPNTHLQGWWLHPTVVGTRGEVHRGAPSHTVGRKGFPLTNSEPKTLWQRPLKALSAVIVLDIAPQAQADSRWSGMIEDGARKFSFFTL